jgi:glycosyltransferase involved in cell wall biosynthesis
LKIAINALFLREKVSGGTETYVTNIVRHWYDAAPPGIDFVFLANHQPVWWKCERSHFSLIKIQGLRSQWRRILYEQSVLPLQSWRWDLLFNPGYVGVAGARCPQVITIHDAYAWILPKEAGRLRTLYWRMMIQITAKQAKRVIAVSENTRSDIVRYTGLSPNRIIVIPESGDHVPMQLNSEADADCGDPYFLSVGFFKDVKNPERTLAAFARYRETRKLLGLQPCRLKLVGAVVGARGMEIQRLAAQTEGVDFCGRVDDTQLHRLVGGAFAFVFASLYEGFGIPILEAQRLGCPVLTSRTSSMPEVAGTGAIFVNPLDIDSIKDGMLRLHDPEERPRLLLAGIANQKRFSWQEASARTLQTLCQAGTGLSDSPTVSGTLERAIGL